MSVVVRGPDGRIMLYTKGAVSCGLPFFVYTIGCCCQTLFFIIAVGCTGVLCVGCRSFA